MSLRLKILCQKHNVFLHLCHISGECMIASGMDGWSRGTYDAGISLGYDLRTFIPLDIPAFEMKGNQLEFWCKPWMSNNFRKPLTPVGWFTEGHLPGIHVWAPPPSAGLFALKELASSHQKRPYFVTHVVFIQRLMFDEEWQRRFEKEIDFWFTLWPGLAWPKSAFEPLTIGISFPMRRQYPWLVRLNQEKMVETGWALSSMSKECHVQVGDYLRKFWLSLWEVPSL